MSHEPDIRTTQHKSKMDNSDLTPSEAMDRAEPGEKCIRFRVDAYDTFKYAAKMPELVLPETWTVYYPEADVSHLVGRYASLDHLIGEDALEERLRDCDSIGIVEESSVEGFA